MKHIYLTLAIIFFFVFAYHFEHARSIQSWIYLFLSMAWWYTFFKQDNIIRPITAKTNLEEQCDWLFVNTNLNIEKIADFKERFTKNQ